MGHGEINQIRQNTAGVINYIVLMNLHSRWTKGFERADIFHLMAPYSNPDLPAKRKHTTNPKLLDDDNVSQDAIKRRRMEVSIASTSNLNTASSSNNNLSQTSTRQASVEAVADKDDTTCHNAGPPKNRNIIIESTDEEDETHSQPTAKKAPTKKDNLAKSEQDTCDDNSPKEELDDEELGKL
jgi:hypothetical protein